MINHMSPYLSNNILPPQQILQANGKASIDALRMAPNSSVLIADNTAPIVWKCVSDGLGNVTADPYDISPHKSQEQIERDNLTITLQSIESRIKSLEDIYEQSFAKRHTEPDDAEFISNKKADAGRKKSAGHVEPDFSA